MGKGTLGLRSPTSRLHRETGARVSKERDSRDCRE